MTKISIEHWRQHIEAAQAQGMALAHYARMHGLSRHALYSANKTLRKQARTPNAASTGSSSTATPFVAVRVAASDVALRAELPNGIVLHWQAACPTDRLLLLQALAALPCSR